MNKTDIYLAIRVPKPRASFGCASSRHAEYWREVAVELDGDVLALDPVSGTYSRHHDLAAAEIKEARRLAQLVREGTHYVSAGVVLEKG